MNGNDRFEILACGCIDQNGGAPIWRFQRGFTGTITDGGVGIWTVTLDGGGCDATQSVILVGQEGAMAAQRLTTFATVHTSDTAKQITIMQETGGGGGAASAAADVSCWVAVIRTNQQP